MKEFKVGQKVMTKDSDSNEYVDGIVLSVTPEAITVQWEDIKEPTTHYPDEYTDIIINYYNV